MCKNSYINVSAGCVDISTEKNPVIGTTSLASCVGFVLYDEKDKRAIVGHCFPDIVYKEEAYTEFYNSICDILIDNELLLHNFELILVEGAYTSDKLMESIYKMLISLPISIIKQISDRTIKNASIQYGDIKKDMLLPNDIAESRCFAFDSVSGLFVTDKIKFEWLKKDLHI